MSHHFSSYRVSEQQIQEIFAQAKAQLKNAIKPEHEDKLKSISMPTPKHNVLTSVLSEILHVFCTQKIGGFITNQKRTRAEVHTMIQSEIQDEHQLVFGIESEGNSVLNQGTYLHHNEVVVYKSKNAGVVSEVQSIGFNKKQKVKVHTYTSETHPQIWICHMSSGTSDPKKYPNNRQNFLDSVCGQVAQIPIDIKNDISFWDANFDVTGNIQDDRPTIPMLLKITNTHPIQFVFPCVRVCKERFADLPFANNQIEKGGIKQVAESMIATFPRDMDINAIDSDGLFVLSNGMIHQLFPNQEATRLDDIQEEYWKEYTSFSDKILLDHKPIRVGANGKTYSFHNFMDFAGAKGIQEPFWYDEQKLRIEDQKFFQYLQSKLPEFEKII